MGQRVPLPLGLKAGTGQSALASSENLINLYPEVARGKALSPGHLLSIPGQTAHATIGGTNKRGQFVAGGAHLAIRDETLYTISGGVATSRGTIEGTNRCDFAYDGTYIAIVADLKSYYYNVTLATLTEVTDPDFDQANSVCVVNNVFVFARNGTGQVAWPSLTDPFAFDALDFGDSETSPDEIEAVRESGQELLIFSHETLEPWRFTGNPDQYFEASGSASALNVGSRWRDTIQNLDNAPFWLATNKEGALYVARLDGYQAKRVSNHAVETNLEKAASLTGSFGFAYASRGHSCYGLTVPDWCTWVYDVSTGEWRQHLGGTWPITTPEIPQGDWGVRDFAVNTDRKAILGKTDGNLYELDYESFSQDSAGIVREITTPPFSLGGVSFSVSEVELIVKGGVGLVTGTGSDPSVQCTWSDDGGQTWEDPLTEDLGALGDYGLGVRFTRLGRCPGPKGRMFRFRCADAVDFTPIEAYITIEPGSR